MTKRLVQGPANPVWLVDANGNAVDTGHGLQLDDGWEVTLLQDVAINDSDKNFTVPVGYEYQVLAVYVSMTTSATVGDRRVTITMRNALGTAFLRVAAGAVQAASTSRLYSFAPSLADRTSFVGTTSPSLTTPIPPTMILPALYQIGITETEAIDALADDMLVYALVARREI